MSDLDPLRPLNLDLLQQQSFVRFFKNLPEKPPGTIRFFNRSDYYTVHEEDATYAANQLFGAQKIKYLGDEPKLSYLVINRNNFEKFVRDLLLVKQYRVEVYVRPSDSKSNDWTLEYKGSPGNISQFDELLFENNEITYSTGVMAINLSKNATISASYINVTEAQMLVTEFCDNELYTELEALIAQICPKECIIPSGESIQLTTLNKILKRNSILVGRAKKNEFNSTDIEQDLNRLVYFYEDHQRNVMALPETKLSEGMKCLQVLIKHLNLIGDEQCYNYFKLTNFDIHRFVRLDNSAIIALNLFPKPGTSLRDQFSKYKSLLGILNMCCTQQGKRLLEQWLRQPLRDINLLRERNEVVQALVNDAESRHMLHSCNLTRVPDILMLIKKLNSKKVTLQDCYRIYQTVANVPPIITILKKCDNTYVRSTLIDPISDLLLDCEKYQEMIEQTIDFNLVDRGEYLIKQNFNEGLQGLANEKTVLEEKMQKSLKCAADDLGMDSAKSLKLDYTDQNGYCFRVTLKGERVLRQNKNYKIIGTVKSGCRFTNNELSKLNERYTEIKNDYEEQQKSIVKEVVEVAVGYATTLRNLNMYIAKIDVLVSFANVAANAPIPFIKPNLLEEGTGVLKLKKVRHPLIEVQDDVTYIPNDVEFKKDDKMFYIITGPNMGGKSTYIRSIGVCVLLAHIGSFVPCAEANISVVDCILARVGASDCQLKGLSTFMLEMVETSNIIKSATSNSLVIIDELGRGTSTYEGCGIAWAVTEHLAVETKCFSLFATHFHEITELSEIHPTIRNVHVSAVTTDTTMTPLYQVKKGPTDKSYGIHCARIAGFPQDILTLASQYQQELEESEGMHNIRDYEIGLKHKIVKEGDLIISEFLTKCRKIDISNLSAQEIKDKVNELKNQLPKDNLFVNGFFKT